MDIVTLETPEMGDRSYLVTDGRYALVVDPQRDIERITDAAERRHLRITHVVETHIHNDYLSGGLALARMTGARYGLSGDEAVGFASERDPLGDGDCFVVGDLTVHVIATPGHTAHHLSYVVTSDTAEDRSTAVFSGGSLLYGAAGRTDLAGADLTEIMARAQWTSIRHLAATAPARATVHPTHGFGSFCSAGGSEVTASTLGAESLANPALLLAQDDFVVDLIARFVAFPRYYHQMAPRNRAGVEGPASQRSHRVTLDNIRNRVAQGEWVVDVRQRRAFAASHLPGTINVEFGTQLATYLGWVFPWGSPLSLLANDGQELAAARQNLGRIGLDETVAESTVAEGDLVAPNDIRSYPVATFADLDAAAERGDQPLVLDVRHRHEWSAGHRPGAMHIPIQDLEGALTTLPRDRTVWVHCAAGYRAAVACSLLDRHGIAVILVDDHWGCAGSSARSKTPAVMAPYRA